MMTRINTIRPGSLTDAHLMAEYRELPMVMSALRRSLKGNRVQGSTQALLQRIPRSYTLNEGHVSFFYDKGRFLWYRWHGLIEELYRRGYEIRPSNRTVNWKIYATNEALNENWTPTTEDHRVNIERICARIDINPKAYKFYGNPIDPERYKQKLYEEYLSGDNYRFREPRVSTHTRTPARSRQAVLLQ